MNINAELINNEKFTYTVDAKNIQIAYEKEKD